MMRGFTLVELLVVLLILSLMGSLSVLAVARLGRDVPTAETILGPARVRSILEGRPVRVHADSSDLAPILFLPDGRAAGPGVDPLTGAVRK